MPFGYTFINELRDISDFKKLGMANKLHVFVINGHTKVSDAQGLHNLKNQDNETIFAEVKLSIMQTLVSLVRSVHK